MFPDSETTEEWVMAKRWGEEVIVLVEIPKNGKMGAKHPSMPLRCRETSCEERLNVRCRTGLEGSKLHYQVGGI